ALARNALWTGVFTPTDVARLYPNGPPALAQPEMADWPYTADTPPHNGLNRLLYWDLRRWLVDDVLMKVDKMSMAASVEARVPFLDHELVEYVASLPASYKLRRGRGKAVLREAFREWLPAQTSARRKAAFRPPLDAWFRGKLGLLANERLRARGSFCRSFLDARAVERVLADHMTGVANNGQRLWTLLCAELWYGQWFGAEREARRSLDRGDAALRISGKSGAGEGTLTLTLSHGDVGEGEVDLSGCEAPGRRFSVASAARAVRGVLLVPDLPSERWPSMDRYARGLLEHLAGIDRDYVVAAPVLNGRNGHRTLASARRYWDRLVAYPASLRSYRPDVIHVLDHTYAHVLRKFGGRPSLVTVHDLWPLRRPHNNSAARQMLLDTLVRRITEGAQSATLLCADSSFSAGEAHELLGIPAARLRVVPLGVEESFFESAAADDVRTFRQVMFSRGGPRLLHVGSCDPRKNIDALLRIVAAIRRAAGRVRLLQVGGRFTTAQRALISELKLDTAVAQRCDLSEVELRLAYQAADVLVLPSLYEGFGFPVLEAQASRLPVVCSNCASLPEVAGDGARLVDGFAPTRWSRTVLEIVESRENRNRMIEAGLRNARRYTWAATARAVSLIYQELLGDPPSNEL
ncbi:MAG: asparagine synthase-related protein, partial [Candidatus Binatia bacterium]